jgi:hypothetical protein
MVVHVQAYAEGARKVHAADPHTGRRAQFGFTTRALCGAFVRYGRNAPAFDADGLSVCATCARAARREAGIL